MRFFYIKIAVMHRLISLLVFFLLVLLLMFLGLQTLTLILQRNLFKQIDGTSSSQSREVRT